MRINIIGAGPIGSQTAYLLSKKGYDVHVFEDHKKIGEPIQCTGLLTMTLSEVIKPKKEYITNETKEIEVFAPNKNKLTIKSKEYIVCRTKFDLYLAKKAKDSGATFHTQHRFLEKKKESIVVKDTKNQKIKEIKNEILIGADGANSSVAKILNPKRTRNYCVGIQARVKGNFETDKYTVYFENNISPGFFAWIVPEDENHARVGLKGTNNNFESFLKMHNFKKLEMQAGPIPIYDPKTITQKNNTFIVGDAATHVKATTAGGIIPGLKAATCLSRAIENNDSYERRWKKKIGKSLWLHLKIRQAMNNFTNNDWNNFIKLLSQKRLKKTFEKYDREKPFLLARSAVLKEPRLLKYGFYTLKS